MNNGITAGTQKREMNHYVRSGRKEVKLAFPPNRMKFLTKRTKYMGISKGANMGFDPLRTEKTARIII